MPTPKSVKADAKDQLASIGHERYRELRETHLTHADLLLLDNVLLDRTVPINFLSFAIIVKAYADTHAS